MKNLPSVVQFKNVNITTYSCILYFSAGSQQPCPTTPVCSCPCQKPPMSGKPPSLQPLPPKNDSINTWCTSVCICLCIGGSPVPIQPPTESASKANVATLNLVVTSPLSNRITTAVPSSTPTIINKSRSTSITCPETAGTCICLSVSVFTILPSNMFFLKCFPFAESVPDHFTDSFFSFVLSLFHFRNSPKLVQNK